MFCGKCGNRLPDGANFCSKCGNKLTSKQPVEIVYDDNVRLRRKKKDTHTSQVRDAGKGSRIIGLLMAVLLLIQVILFFVPFCQLSKDGMLPDSDDRVFGIEYAATKSLREIMTDGADGPFCYLTLALLAFALTMALGRVMLPQKRWTIFALFTIVIDGWMIFLLNQFSNISSRYTITSVFHWSIAVAFLTAVFSFLAVVMERKC